MEHSQPSAIPSPPTPATVQLGPQGRIVIPIALRHKLGLKAGDAFVIRSDTEGRLVLERRGHLVQRLQGRCASLPDDVSLADVLVEERHQAVQRGE
ncbi:MAG: AbrB/MazE/SpoVT family DNA-binding domain-containing protein [Polyangiales bacterium]